MCRLVHAKLQYQEALTRAASTGLWDQAWADTVLAAAMLEQLAAPSGSFGTSQQLPEAVRRGVAAACGLVDNAVRGIQPEVGA